MVMSEAKYQEYLQSTWWQKRRKLRLEVAGGQCEFRSVEGRTHQTVHYSRCTRTKQLEVHHRHFESLGAKKDEGTNKACHLS
jgi:hypothetical protein